MATTKWEKFDAILRKLAESIHAGIGSTLTKDERRFMWKVIRERMIPKGIMERGFTFMLNGKLTHGTYYLIRRSPPDIDIMKATFEEGIRTEVEVPVTVEEMAIYAKAREEKEKITPNSNLLPAKK